MSHVLLNSSPLSTFVLLCGQEHTYVCEAGDAHPLMSSTISSSGSSFFELPPITPSFLESFWLHTTSQGASSTMPINSLEKEGIDNSHILSKNSTKPPEVLELQERLKFVLQKRHVVAVVPLSWASTAAATSTNTMAEVPARSTNATGHPHYLHLLTQFLLHPLISVNSLIVVSDVVASAVACGRTSGVLVIHASPHACCIGYVVEGCAKRYASCRWEALYKGLIKINRDDPAAEEKQINRIDCCDEACRTALLDVFGESLVHSFESNEASTYSSGTAKPGRLQQLLNRIYDPQLSHDVIVVGEAIQSASMGLLEKLLCKMVMMWRPADLSVDEKDTMVAEETRVVVELEGSRKRKRMKSDLSIASKVAKANSNSSSESSSAASSESESDEESACSSSGTSVSGSKVDNCSGLSSLRLVSACPPNAPCWAPLIGGSIIAQYSEKEVRTMRILPHEAVETGGKVVYWKALL